MNFKELSKVYGENVAMATALKLNRRYKKVDFDSRMVIGADIGKSGFFRPNYFLTMILSSASVDAHNQKMSKRFLKSIENYPTDIKLLYGNEHFKGNTPVSSSSEQIFKDGKLYVKVHLDKTSKYFKDVVKQVKKGINKVSIELKNALIDTETNTIIDGKVEGFRLVKRGANPDAKVLSHNL